MGVKPINADTPQCSGEFVLKRQLGAVDRWTGRKGTMVDKCLAEIRIALQDLDVVGKVHRVREHPLESPHRISYPRLFEGLQIEKERPRWSLLCVSVPFFKRNKEPFAAPSYCMVNVVLVVTPSQWYPVAVTLVVEAV